jgi:hypothetical protein
MRLIELAAVAIHQIAVQLYQLDTSLHKDYGSQAGDGLLRLGLLQGHG